MTRVPDGSTTTVSWSVVPTDACNTFYYWVDPSGTTHTISPACGVHTATFSITPGPLIDYKISASASGWTSSTALGSFYNPDISTSYDFENYVVNYNYRQEDTITYYPKAYETGDVMHDHTTTSTTSWTPHYVYFHLDSNSAQHASGIRHITATLYVYDLTTPFSSSDVWLFGNDARPSTVSGITTAGVSDTFSGNIPGVPFSASWGMACGTGNCVYGYGKGWPNTYPGDGSLEVGYADIEWNPEYTSSLDVTFQMAVMNVLAQKHYMDRLAFKVVASLTIDQVYNFLGIPLAWSGYQDYISYTIALGNGSPAGDQYTDLQAGTEAINFWG